MAFFFTLLLFAATFILGELLRPKPNQENAKPADLGDFNFPTAIEGRNIPVIWGTVKVEGPNVTWYGDLVQQAITKKVKTGIFSSSRVTTGFRYFVGIQFSLCRGPVDALLRIWIDDKVVWTGTQDSDGTVQINEPELFGGEELGAGGVVGPFSFRLGSETQNPPSYLDSRQQIPGISGYQAPGYRGTSFGVLEQGLVGTSTQLAPWAFELRRIPTQLGATHANVQGDANPAHVLYEIMTNDEWGLAQPSADVDIPNFQEAAATLHAEANGFSFVLDRTMDIAGLIREIEQQIDGMVFLDQETGRWQIGLARDDYDPHTLEEIDEDDTVEVRSYTRGSWDDTTNNVTLQYVDRTKDYFGTYAQAQDMANFRIQGANVKANIRYPGVKRASLANNLAWRELRSLSFPFAQATVIVGRKHYALKPTQVIAYTNEALGLDRLPMRITRIDFGELQDGRIELTLVEDIFTFKTPSFGDPPPSEWQPPTADLVPIPAGEQVVIEAPKAFVDRDPDFPTVPNRVWASGRFMGDGAVVVDLRNRVGANPFVTGTEIPGFLLAGQLVSGVGPDTANPLASLIIGPVDGQTVMLGQFENVSDEDIGVNLEQIILVGGEFMGVRSAQPSGGNVQLNTVHRGLLDSVPAEHAIGERVWLLFVNGGVSSSVFQAGQTVNVKLVTRAAGEELPEGDATTVNVTLQNRTLRPYPPVDLELNASAWPAAASLDVVVGFGLDARATRAGFRRRDFRTGDEVASPLPGDFPAVHDTRYRARLFIGVNELFVTGFNGGAAIVDVNRTRVLRHNNAAVPSALRVEVETRHTLGGSDFDALQRLRWEYDPQSSDLAGLANLGVVGVNDPTGVYTAQTAGSHIVKIGTALLTGNVQARINGGAWETIIPSGVVAGLVALGIGDELELRRTTGTHPLPETLFIVQEPET